MDRDRIRATLRAGHRTWRWNRGARDGYEAVETTAEGLLWYRWSHHLGGGRHDELHQTFEAFATDGPARSAPPQVLRELSRWIDERLRV